MQTAFTIKASFEVFIDLDDHDITEQDILNAFGSEERELTEGDVRSFIVSHLDPEWILENGNIQTASITRITAD